jgi:ABC-type transporter Mla MlaB component
MTGTRPHTLVLSGDGGIKAAAEIAASLKAALDAHQHIDVDTQTLTGADVTTAQTLLAARASAAAEGKVMHLLAPLGPPLALVLQQAGFLAAGQDHRGFWAASPDHA